MTKNYTKYLHDKLEIKDIRCIYQGREWKREREWQSFLFSECIDIKLEEVVQLIYHFFYIATYST